MGGRDFRVGRRLTGTIFGDLVGKLAVVPGRVPEVQPHRPLCVAPIDRAPRA
jgi:hypothetical protein